MGVRVELSLFGDTQLSREIMRVHDRAGNLNPAFRSIFDRMLEINSEQMRTQGLRGLGGFWEPLKPATIASKIRRGRDLDILFDSHALFEAMSSPSSEDNEMIFNEDWAVFRITGEPATYGPTHQHGDDSRGIPKRPFFVFTRTDREQMIKEMERFLLHGTLGHFVDI